MGPSPSAHILNQRQNRPAIIAQRILDRRGHGAFRLAADEAVVDEFAKLLCENFLRDPGHRLSQCCEVFRRFSQPVDDDQLPLTADSGEGGGEWTTLDRVGPYAPVIVT